MHFITPGFSNITIRYLSLLNVISSCDTSVFCQEGKLHFIKVMQINPDLETQASAFLNENAQGDVNKAGKQFLTQVYTSTGGSAI